MAAGALGGCALGGDPPATEADVTKAVRDFHRAQALGDGSACRLMTEKGQKMAAGFFEEKTCEKTFSYPGKHPKPSQVKDADLPPVGPVGADGNSGMAVVHLGDSEEEQNWLLGLKRIDGRWLIDFYGFFPEPGEIEGNPDKVEEVLQVVNHYQRAVQIHDGKAACALLMPDAARETGTYIIPRKGSAEYRQKKRNPCEYAVDQGIEGEDSPRFNRASVVGDLAIAHSAEVGRGLDFMILTKDGWRISGMSFGDYH
jgi:ketosteroid isomerase-like protein